MLLRARDPTDSGAARADRAIQDLRCLPWSARLYRPDVQSRFRLGRLLSVRDRIVHEGIHPVIHTRVLDLMGAVYGPLACFTQREVPFAGDAGALLGAEQGS